MKHHPLSAFHPLLGQWFTETIGEPTDLQNRAWPLIVNGEHVLITAPTGSGKTLAAFFWALNQIITAQWPPGRTSVVYVSPLKALNNDIQRNLLTPLSQLKTVFGARRQPFPEIEVLTRSGDTPASDRRSMLRRPPQILITTPESLNLLVSARGGRTILGGVCTVILDEIHALAGTKRGVHLVTAVERLAVLSGEFQRIALSATINPPEAAARLIGGYRIQGGHHAPRFVPRPVSVVRSSAQKSYQVSVHFPNAGSRQSARESFWEPLVAEVKKIIVSNRSTLVFVNSRRLCEKLTHLINVDEPQAVAYSHHGSLSPEIRLAVEEKLKNGALRAIVATNSLELGIDIGELDQVIVVQSPGAVSSAIQRIGRAGHRVGQVSRGVMFPTHAWDIAVSAVLARGVTTHDIEASTPVQCPLDVLAQVIIAMAGMETLDIDELYTRLRACEPFHHLPRRQYDLVLNMLAGRYAHTRIRELTPQVSIDRLEHTVAAGRGAMMGVYLSGGTIPDRGYFHLRHDESNSRIGELDEEFVWEASLGQVFTLGAQNWRIQRITHNEVFVIPAPEPAIAPPFWIAEALHRDFHFSVLLGRFMEILQERLDDPDLTGFLQRYYFLSNEAADHLIAFLKGQKQATGCPLPNRHHLVLERVKAVSGAAGGNQIVLHTLWGGRVNRPLSIALAAAWESRFGHRLQIHAGNDCIVLLLPHAVDADEILGLVTPANLESLLRQGLEASPFFGARFRECAGRALLLPRRKHNQRVPLWLNRLRSSKLLNAVSRFNDFPILLETWRTCLKDEFEIDALKQVLGEMQNGVISLSEVVTNSPSPMALTVSWRQVNELMYADDTPEGAGPSNLRRDLMGELVFSPQLRPLVKDAVIKEFMAKRHRSAPAYAPASSRGLVDWVKERLIIPIDEWEGLLEAMRRDQGEEYREIVDRAAGKLVLIRPPSAAQSAVVAAETVYRVLSGLYGDRHNPDDFQLAPMSPGASLPAIGRQVDPGEPVDEIPAATQIVGEWLRYYGPIKEGRILQKLGIARSRLRKALDDLASSGELLAGELSEGGGGHEICDRENFETLLRMGRARARPAIEPLSLDQLSLFLAQFQGLTRPRDNAAGLAEILEGLLCYSTKAALWESEMLPARLTGYDPSWLDTLAQTEGFMWVGTGPQSIAFCFANELNLLMAPPELENGALKGLPATDLTGGNIDEGQSRQVPIADQIPDPNGRYDFGTLLRTTGLGAADLTRQLWEAAWQGRLTNDTFAALRQGLDQRFEASTAVPAGYRRRHGRRVPAGRGRFSRWRAGWPSAGTWRRVPAVDKERDVIAAEELKKERVRLLLDRYGILFRELLAREQACFRWSEIFRTLRLMEFSAEVISGYFFDGVPGPQFISHRALRQLQRPLHKEAVYWLNAADPASLCGIRLTALKSSLPPRLASTHLTYHGARLVLVSRQNGKKLTFHVPPDAPRITSYLGSLAHLLTRRFQPLKHIGVETINDSPSADSPYADVLKGAFDAVADHHRLILYSPISL